MIALLLAGMGWLLLSCTSSEKNKEQDTEEASYIQEVLDWQENRAKRLKAEDGWLNLSGLFWLDSTWKSMGYGPGHDFVISHDTTPITLAHFRTRGDSIEILVEEGIMVEMDSLPIREALVSLHDGSFFASGMLRWFFIERDGALAIRLRDLAHPSLQSFEGLEYYPIDTTWRKKASFKAFIPAGSMEVGNVLGSTSRMKVIGRAGFDHDNKTYELLVFEGGPEYGFIIYGDKTNGHTTYGSGRYLYAKLPESGKSEMVIDFNKGYSPPCAFTEFATCPFPPAENILDMEVLAGELAKPH